MYQLKTTDKRGVVRWEDYPNIHAAHDAAVIAEECGQATDLYDEYGKQLTTREVNQLLEVET